MNNYIIISKTFSETTPESAEDGDFSDMGFITEHEEVTFSELGTSREECIHFHTDNTPNAAKYWKYARIAANNNIAKHNELLFA